MPYPIFLGYAVSDDDGQSWMPDFSKPALAPRLAYERESIYTTDARGNRLVNFGNGGYADPRMIWLEGEAYVTVAGRMFPPGPYWEIDNPTQCAPDWIRDPDQPFGRAARDGTTVTLLFRLDLDALTARCYEEAFRLIAPVTDPNFGDNRDTYLFPERLWIGGRRQYVLIHRSTEPYRYSGGSDVRHPSILLAAAERLEDFTTPRATHRVLATPTFDWEANRIGGSWPPLRISPDEWLVPYHAKRDAVTGYTQSFMIVRERADDFPEIRHRCSTRVMYARQPWELVGVFPTPCLFTVGGIQLGDILLMSYGAGDTKTGVARTSLSALTEFLRCFDANGVYCHR